MKKITVRTKAAKKLRAGYPLLVAEDLNSPLLEDDFAQFFDEKGQALGTGYLSKQKHFGIFNWAKYYDPAQV